MTKKQNSRKLTARMIACVLSVCLLLCTLAACQGPADPTNGSSFPTTAPSPTDKPTEPTPPAPTDPAPTEPAPTEPAPTEPTPTEPAPTEPAPTEPIADYSWLVGTWSSAVRNDEPDSISTLSLLSITFLENGRGSIKDDGLTNFDIINGCLLDHWAAPGDIAFTSEEFTYAIEGDKLAITFVYHEFVAYEPFTVYFPIPEPANGMITLGEPTGNIHGAALGGSLIGRTFVKGPISVEDLCTVLGVDYSVPPIQGNEGGEIPQWLVGSWETAWRDDANNSGQPYLITSGYVFLEDGTGYTLGHEYWAWDMENNCPSSTWDSVPMGYPSTYFTYSLNGDQLTITFIRDDFEEYQPPYPTDVKTLIQNADGSITLSPSGRTYAKDASTIEILCAMLGVDYSLPQIEESPYTKQLQQNSWHICVRNDLGQGLTELRTYSIEFDENGSGYYYLSSHLMNRSRGELSSAWNKQSITTKEYISFQYSLSGEELYVTTKDGQRNGYKIEIVDQIMKLTKLESDQVLRFATGRSFHYIDKLCELIGVYYDPPKLTSAEKLVGSMQTAWRDDASYGYPAQYHATFQFNADGTGTYTRRGYIAWDMAQNTPLDHWVDAPELGHMCSFTYTMNEYKLDIQCTCDDPGCCSGSYILYYYGNERIFMHAQDGTKELPFHQLIQTEQDMTQEMICEILGISYSVTPDRAHGVSQKTLAGTWQTANRPSEYILDVTSYIFRNDATGEIAHLHWSCISDRGYIQDHWEQSSIQSTPAAYTYTLRGNRLTIEAKIYRDYFSIYQYTLAILSDGSLLMIPEYGDHARFISADSATTLEQLCSALNVDLTLSQ